MIEHEVRTNPSSARLPREEQLAWKRAAVANAPVDVLAKVSGRMEDAHADLCRRRLPGWTAHIAGQLAGKSFIRPVAAYDGPAERHLAR